MQKEQAPGTETVFNVKKQSTYVACLEAYSLYFFKVWTSIYDLLDSWYIV